MKFLIKSALSVALSLPFFSASALVTQKPGDRLQDGTTVAKHIRVRQGQGVGYPYGDYGRSEASQDWVVLSASALPVEYEQWLPRNTESIVIFESGQVAAVRPFPIDENDMDPNQLGHRPGYLEIISSNPDFADSLLSATENDIASQANIQVAKVPDCLIKGDFDSCFNRE